MAGGRPSCSAIYQRLDKAITDLNERLGGLPSPAEADGIWADLWIKKPTPPLPWRRPAHPLGSAELLDKGRAVGDKELREYMEVLGYAATAKR